MFTCEHRKICKKLLKCQQLLEARVGLQSGIQNKKMQNKALSTKNCCGILQEAKEQQHEYRLEFYHC
jgi:hypothetical protein